MLFFFLGFVYCAFSIVVCYSFIYRSPTSTKSTHTTAVTYYTLKMALQLFGYNSSELWPIINVIMPTWMLLMFVPKWKYTPSLALIGPLMLSVMYVITAASKMMDTEDNAPIDFSSLEGVVAMFQDPDAVFAGWIHYCVYDALVGRWIVMDSVERGASGVFHALVIVPMLILAFIFGPTGWLVYMAIVRPFFLPKKIGTCTGETTKKNA